MDPFDLSCLYDSLSDVFPAAPLDYASYDDDIIPPTSSLGLSTYDLGYDIFPSIAAERSMPYHSTIIPSRSSYRQEEFVPSHSYDDFRTTAIGPSSPRYGSTYDPPYERAYPSSDIYMNGGRSSSRYDSLGDILSTTSTARSRDSRDYESKVTSYMFPHREDELLFGPSSLSVKSDDWYNRTSDNFRDQYSKAFLSDASGKRYSRYSSADVSHIISEANGGINATENVFVSSSSFNRSIGDRGDHINAALVGKRAACTAARVSRKYGDYTGPIGSKLYDQGVRELARDGILVKQDGGIDRRCKAVRSGDIILRSDGRIDGRSSYVRRGKKAFY